MRIYQKLLVGPASTIIFFLMFGAVTFIAMQSEKSALEDIYHNRFGNFEASAHSAKKIATIHSNVYRLFTWFASYNEQKIHNVTQEQNAKIDEVVEVLKRINAKDDLTDQEKKLLETVIGNLASYKKHVNMSIDLALVDPNTGMAAMQTADNTYKSLITNLDELVSLETDQAELSFDGALAGFNQALFMAVVILLAAVVVSVLVSSYMGRLILRPLHQAVKVAKQVAGGDLTSRIEVFSKDETGELLQSLQYMNDNLANIVANVRNSTSSIVVATKEIADGNGNLSQRTSEQASSLEETAASLEELTSTVKQNAEHSTQASHLASSGCDIAVKGGDIVGQVVVTMGMITESSKKIVDIISVIEGIAYQTNLLALNAAVEAARAGEQGRGFAVVASEVRNLAQRSADAAKQIKSLIDDSASKVASGSKLVNEAGQTMAEIVSSIKKVSNIIDEIAAASIEQSSGIEQVNQAVVQMDGVTQQNAAMVEEASAVAAALEDQARKLNEAVNVFKLAQTEHKGDTVRKEPARSRPESRSTNIRTFVAPALSTAGPTVTHVEAFGRRKLKVAEGNTDWKEF